MAAVSGTFTTFPAIGEREDLTDAIYDISPTERPFMSSVGRGDAKAVYHEFQTDALASASASNAVIEGDDASFTTASPTTRLGNYCQISRKEVLVSGTLRAVDTAGRADEFAYQSAKAGRELARDIESALCQNGASTAGGTGTARTLAGLESWLSTNKTALSGTTTPTTPGASGGTPGVKPTADGGTSALTESPVKAIIKAIWDQGGDPKMALVGSGAKQTISGFSGVAPLRTDAPARGSVTIVAGVDLYRSDFGEIRIVPSHFVRSRVVSLLDTDYWSVAYLRGVEREMLAKTGDADKAMILAEYTLVSKNEAASGKITEVA